MSSIRTAAFAVVASGALALSACTSEPATPTSGGEGAGQDSTVTLGLTYVPNVQFAPVYVAEAKGLYDQAGAAVEIRHHGAEEGLFTALVSGEEDVVLASGDEVLQARDSGMDLVSIATYYRHSPVTVIVPEDSGIVSLADLRGKKVGLPGEFGSNWYALLSILRSEGIDRSEVEVVSIGYTQQAAIAQGQVDAVVGFSNNDLVQMEAAGLEVRSIAPLPSQVPLVSASLVSTRAWLEANPEEAKAVIQGTLDGIRTAIGSTDEVIAATRAHDPSLTGEAEENARLVWEATVPLFLQDDQLVSARQDVELWQRMADFFGTVPNMLHAGPDVDLAVTNDYVTE